MRARPATPRAIERSHRTPIKLTNTFFRSPGGAELTGGAAPAAEDEETFARNPGVVRASIYGQASEGGKKKIGFHKKKFFFTFVHSIILRRRGRPPAVQLGSATMSLSPGGERSGWNPGSFPRRNDCMHVGARRRPDVCSAVKCSEGPPPGDEGERRLPVAHVSCHALVVNVHVRKKRDV